jgi:MFS family permease
LASPETSLAFLKQNSGWLAAGALMAFSSSYGQTFFISIFAAGIREDYGLSHSEWGGLYGASTLASAAVMIWLGTTADRIRAARLGAIVLIMLALACLAMSVNQALWMLFGIVFFLRLGGQGMMSHLSQVTMARWFARSRGKALGIASLGFSIGEALLPILFVALLTVFDWRSLWVLAAVMAFAAILPLTRILRNERVPQSIAEDSQVAGMGGRNWTRPEVLRHWLFWCLFPALLGPPAFGTAFFFQQVHVAEIKGWSHLDLVALFPLYTASSIVAMLFSGWLVDRIGSTLMMPFAQFPMALGFLVIGLTDSYAGTALGIMLMAATHGANATVPGAFWADFFGTKHLGAIRSLVTAVMVLGSAIGPALTGWLIDGGFPLTVQLPGIAIYLVLANLLVGLVVFRAARRLPAAA